MNETLKQKLDALDVAMREAFAEHAGGVMASNYGAGSEIVLTDLPTVDAGMELLRSIGIGDREKQVIENGEPWTSVEGKADSGIRIKAFCAGIPRTCRLETYTEKVPKRETVDTGDFVEVRRVKVVCGDEPGKEQEAQ